MFKSTEQKCEILLFIPDGFSLNACRISRHVSSMPTSDFIICKTFSINSSFSAINCDPKKFLATRFKILKANEKVFEFDEDWWINRHNFLRIPASIPRCTNNLFFISFSNFSKAISTAAGFWLSISLICKLKILRNFGKIQCNGAG